MSTPRPTLIRIDAHAIADAGGVRCGSGGMSVLVEYRPDRASRFPWRILAAGPTTEVAQHEANRSPAMRIASRPGCLLIPGMVNAHTHLDLTHIGPRPHDPELGFGPWVGMIRDNRRTTAEGVSESVDQGAVLSLRAGVVAVGDIAGAVAGRASLLAVEALKNTPLSGVSFIEFFAFGPREHLALGWLDEALREAGRRGWHADPLAPVQVGVQPHAPYSVSPNAYLAAAPGFAGRFCTHLAESPEERRFLTRAEGPLREMIESLGLWTADAERVLGKASSPIQHVRENALRRVSLVAHVNDASDDDLDLLAEAGVSVAYCPRASAYFGAERHFGPHRYREMLARGINVALGTDSIVNLPPEATQRGISIWDEMRFLHARDQTDPLVLLRMGTRNAAKGLELPSGAFEIRDSHNIAGLVAVDTSPDRGKENPLESALRSVAEPELLLHSTDSCLTGVR
jgi:cytosine/adenosine deaminase-related metal-dependent hydrolase